MSYNFVFFVTHDTNIIFLSSTFITTLLIFFFIYLAFCRFIVYFVVAFVFDHILKNWLNVANFLFFNIIQGLRNWLLCRVLLLGVSVTLDIFQCNFHFFYWFSLFRSKFFLLNFKILCFVEIVFASVFFFWRHREFSWYACLWSQFSSVSSNGRHTFFPSTFWWCIFIKLRKWFSSIMTENGCETFSEAVKWTMILIIMWIAYCKLAFANRAHF